MLLNGDGGVTDHAFGLHLIQVAAEHGANSACLFLAHCYESGTNGFKKDATLVKKWQEAAWDIENERDFAPPIAVDDHLTDRPGRPGYRSR